jgi:hypothetical protein
MQSQGEYHYEQIFFFPLLGEIEGFFINQASVRKDKKQ